MQKDPRKKTCLTRSEVDILRMADECLTSKEMAKRRGTSKRTIDCHRSNIILFFDVKSLQEAVLIAKRKNMI
jgi:DNA-binding NarL/FixJ family response regulator